MPAASTRTVTKKVAGIDHICWMVENPAVKRGWEHRNASRNDIVELPAAEAERLKAYLVDADAPDDIPAAAFTPASDEELSSATVEQLTAYLGQVPEDQHDDELARIIDLEEQRPEPRVTVLTLDPAYRPADPDA